MNICIDCGNTYEYNSDKPKGASSVRCAECRKKDTKYSQKYKLLNIAGEENISCYRCGYSRSIYALTLYDIVDPLIKPVTQEEKEKQAKNQIILCLNCLQEIKDGDIKINVNSSHPKSVSFFEAKVILQCTSTEIRKEKTNVEIVEEIPREATRVDGITKRISCQSIEV
jgi:LSD1 subclass zinc finger protein